MTTSPAGIELRPVTADEMAPFVTATHRAFGDDVRPDRLERDVASIAPERTLAAFDRADIVGAAAIYTFDMTVPGGPTPVAGVTGVGVLATHRRRGILTSLMRRQLTELHEQHREPVAALWASEPAIYRRYGYGLASRRLRLTAQSKLPYVAGAPSSQPLRLLPAEAARDAVAAIYERARPGRPGMLSRFPQRWEGVFDDVEASREGASSLSCALLDSGDGYALYRTKGAWDDWLPNGTVIVRELVALDPAAYAAVWRYLLDIDLMTKVEAWNRPLDEPLQHLVADQRRLHPTLSDAVWVRLVDVDRALECRSYATADSLVIEVVDPVCPWNTGRFAIDVEAADAAVAVRRTDSTADLTLSAVELGAIYLGGTRLRDLAAAGFVDEHTPGATARADRFFAGQVEPWCPEVF